MIDFSLTTKQLEIQEKYRDFADRFIRPNRMKYDESCEFPWDIVKQAYKELGLFGGESANDTLSSGIAFARTIDFTARTKDPGFGLTIEWHIAIS